MSGLIHSADRQRCVVLVPVAGAIHPACEAALDQLERQGYVVRRVYGYAAIDQARNEMAAAALSDGFDELMWIDSDVAFDADAVDRLRGHGLPIVCGVYARKGLRALACHVLPGTTRLVFGVEGGLAEVLYSGTGFMLVQRHVFLELQERLRLPVCNQRFACRSIPFFQPMIIPDGENHWYLPEDYAFCERARQCGYAIMADMTIRLWHHGSYGFSWEDAGKDKERYETFYFNLE